MKLDASNYHSREANQVYMSVSIFKDFAFGCEAQALAKLNGWAEPTPDAFLLGSFVHAAVEGEEAMAAFIESNPQMFSSKGPTKGELKAEFKHVGKMIATILDDPLCRQMLEGKKEVIVTAELFGVPWKAKIDVLAEDRIVDLKTVKSIREKYWLNGAPVSFVEAYGYVTQMSVYTELERLSTGRTERLEPFIVAVSKENTPDKCVVMFDEQSIERELAMVEARLPRVMAVKQGLIEPKRCEKCEYCRQTKRAEIVHYQSLIESA